MLRLLLSFSFLACFTSALISLAHLYHPSVLGPLVLTWGTSGAADVIHGLVVFLVLVPASLVFYAIWGHLPGEAETEKNEAGSALEGRRAREKPCPAHLAPVSPSGAERPPDAR